MADKDPKLEHLRRVPLFSRCDGLSLADIARLSDEVDVADGHTLMRQGALGSEFFLIVDGRVRIERDGATINTLGPGDFLGEIALLAEERRTATAVTEGPAKVLVLTRGAFMSLLDTSAGIRSAVLEALGARIRHLEPDSLD